MMKRLYLLATATMACLLLAACAQRSEPVSKTVQDYKNDQLPVDVQVIRDVEYGKAGDVSLKLNVIRPKTPEKEKLPVLVWIHGGGWVGGNKDDATGLLCGFAQQGYVCVSVEYRFADVATFPAQIQDCKAAIRFLRANADKYGIDTQRFGVWGDSAGGHLVSLLGTSGSVPELEGDSGNAGQSSAVQAVCDWYGPVGFARGTLNKDDPVSVMLGGTPQDNRELARQSDPVTFIDGQDPPFLIMHGDKDNVVPLWLSQEFNKSLKAAKVDVTLDIIPGAGHGDGFWGVPAIYSKVLAFFDRTLKK